MSFEVAKEKALRYLILAKKTEYEVREKLKKSKFEDEVINKVISYLSKLGYINDEEYVDAYIRQCMRLQNYSIYEIKQKLLQKGIKKYIIEEKIIKLENIEYERDLIKKILDTKCKNMDHIKQKQYLYRRGFKINSIYE